MCFKIEYNHSLSINMFTLFTRTLQTTHTSRRRETCQERLTDVPPVRMAGAARTPEVEGSSARAHRHLQVVTSLSFLL